MYQPYVDSAYYFGVFKGTALNEENADKYLKQASRDIDILTYCRISRKGFDSLSDYRKDIVQEVCCEHASFLYENEMMIKTYLRNYNINGVSMSFGNSWNVYVESGVAIDRSLYERLCTTGLCCRSFYYG